MKKIYLSLVVLLLSKLIYAADITVTPSNFGVSSFSGISDGTTIFFEDGTYTITQGVIDAWSASVTNKVNVTFKPAGTGAVKFDAMGLATQVELILGYADNLRLEKLTFANVKVKFSYCTNSTMDQITSTEQKYDHGWINNVALLGIQYGDNCTISNSTLKWTFTGWNGKAIRVYRGTNHKFINNTITGRLRGAMELMHAESLVPSLPNGKVNFTVQGGYMERTLPLGSIHTEEEDHGIYLHDVSGSLIENVTIKGWSVTARGGSVKIKNLDDVEIRNNTFHDSGILVRTGSSGWQHMENIYIHGNTIYGGFGISTYMTPNAGYDNPTALVYENNLLYDDGIQMTYDAGAFNTFCARANKDGGIYNNGYGQGTNLNISSGVNLSGNYELNPSPVAVFNVSVSPSNLSVGQGATAQLSATVSPSNATNQNVTWSSSNTSVATVSASGIVTAISGGLAVITVTTEDGSKTATCDVTVTVPTTYNESFENLSGTGGGGTWTSNESFSGDQISWTILCKKVENYINTGADKKGIYFHKDVKGLVSETMSDGLGSFKVKCKNKWSDGQPRKIELYVNGLLKATVDNLGVANEIYTADFGNINVAGDVKIEVKNASSGSGNGTIAFDDLEWTNYSPSARMAHAQEERIAPNTESGMSLYPNPITANGLLTVQLSANSQATVARVNLLDLSGKSLYLKPRVPIVNREIVLPLDINRGTYVLIVQTDTDTFTLNRKFLVR